MGKEILLSYEISKTRALLAGGLSASDALKLLKQWAQASKLSTKSRIFKNTYHWYEILCMALQDCIPLGARVGDLLKEIQPIIRQQERYLFQLQSLERQFGFQGAIALVLPWAVVAVSGKINFNIFTFIGILLQLAGLLFFYFKLKVSLKTNVPEETWVFEFFISVLMRLSAGLDLHNALSKSLDVNCASKFRTEWKQWLSAYNSGADLIYYKWPSQLKHCIETSQFILPLLRSGAPALQAVTDIVSQLVDLRQTRLTEKLGQLPTQLSLIFCIFFTPAVFLLFLGSIWPTLNFL